MNDLKNYSETKTSGSLVAKPSGLRLSPNIRRG